MEEAKAKKRVLLVVRWPVGGIRTFLKYLISEFPTDSYSFSVVGAETEGMNSLRLELEGRVDDWTLVPADGKIIRSISRSVIRLSRDQKFDVIHAHGFTSAIACVPVGLISRSTFICTSHDVIREEQFRGIKGSIRRAILAISLWRCSVIHSVSNDAESNLLSYFPFMRGKSVKISNGIDVRLFRDSEYIDLHGRVGVDSSVKVIGFFGRFMNQKGFKYLVSAIDILRQDSKAPSIHVVCFGSGAFIREEQAQIGRRKLESYFSFFPFSPDVSGLMKGCDLVVMPSLWEACGLVAMEALVAGVPLVGSNCIGLAEVLEGTPAIQTVAGDSVSLANGILESLERGREPFETFAPVAAEWFDVRKTAREIFELYEKVIR